MKRRVAAGGGVALMLLLLGGFLLVEFQRGGASEEASRHGTALPERARLAPPEPIAAAPRTVSPSEREVEPATSGREPRSGAGTPESTGALHAYDIEEIKRQIYERRIESTDRLHLLDELVQTGDADTRGFWGDDWSGVDDWKRSSNGFSLESTGDGTLIFIPDEKTARTYTFFENVEVYTYDEPNRAFVNEIDFYGKTIHNVIKFINPDVLAMMTISGSKVDLNIYQRSADSP
jgi:hypothetical protein